MGYRLWGKTNYYFPLICLSYNPCPNYFVFITYNPLPITYLLKYRFYIQSLARKYFVRITGGAVTGCAEG